MGKELTIDVARDMYASGNEAMKAYALEFFSEEELKPKERKVDINKFPTSYEQSISLFPNILRLGFTPLEIESSELLKHKDWNNYIWMVSDDADMPMRFIYLSCILCIRNAWWKIDNNWKPVSGDFKYVITCRDDEVISTTTSNSNYILCFSSEEIRDLFYSTFYDILNNIKEFL